jgi:YD repeat-containing protein
MIAGITPGTAHQGFLAGKAATSDPLQQTEYTYDSAGRLTGILSNGAPIVSYQYDGLGRPIQKTFGNGMIAMISYDTAGRLSDITFSGVPLGGNPAIRSQTSEVSAQNPTSSSHLPTSTPSLDLQYQWDSANQLTSRTWNGQTQLYAYDPSGQLLSVTDGNSKALLESYAYEKQGI